MKQATTLFLHGGPGLSAIVERALYGETLPVVWWDQPRCEVLFARPYQALLDDVALEAEHLASRGGGKINLLAHSFGAHLALYLAMLMPERIGSITLLAPVFNPADALTRVGEHLTYLAPDRGSLRDALVSNREQNSFDSFWTLVERILEVPGFLDVYWGPESHERRRWFLSLIEREPWLDINTLRTILLDYWAGRALTVRTTVRGPVGLVFGVHDVLVDAAQEAVAWKRYFPQATSRQLNAGHFVHLETPPHLWLPGRT
ncbi:alpha/beta fold hydrolase [Paraburkholderia sp. RL17-337-BIB-A]|uniref:alpha/beta fold hydrolase n=1 Tax=Paraburkholderia sp. RL17-337-BIB-A TaxID=3031636 RepID=UPI0038B993EE